MSYENDKLMNLEDGQLLLSAVDKRKADIISVSDTTPSPVKTLTDGADGLPMGVTVGIEPVQDLHGYDNPWPAGGGKNLVNIADATITVQTTVGTVTLQQGTYTASADVKNNGQVLGYFRLVVSGTAIAQINIEVGDNTRKSVTFTLNEETTVSVLCNGASSGYNFSISKVMIESGSTATDYSPYSNVCPISGWTGANVTRTGKNLLNDNLKAKKGAEIQIGTTVFGANIPSIILPAGTYTMSVVLAANLERNFYARDIDTGTYIPGFPAYIAYSTDPATKTFTLTKTTRIRVWTYNTEFTSVDDVISWQIELGSSASSYEAYVGNTYPISFPSEAGTVYGGTLTVNADGTGTLVVDCVKHDLPTTGWDKLVSGANIYSRARNSAWDEIPKSYSSGAKQLCNCLIPTNSISSASHTPWTVAIYNENNNYLRICFPDDESFDTKEEAMAWIAANAPYVVYEVATPITYNLTASQVNALITSLKGVNNLYADSGDVLSVDYSADTKLYVDGKISEGMKLMALLLTANHEDGMKASKAYASGDLLTVGNTLYKATTSIANGATLTEGTNVTETTIAQELAALA